VAFPAVAAFYVSALPTNGTTKCTITGTFAFSAERPYFDVLVGNQETTQTDDALPGSVFLDEATGTYAVDVLAPDYEGSASDFSIRWKPENTLPIIIMRFIDFTAVAQDYITSTQGNPLLLTPERTQATIPDIYPTITFVEELYPRV